VTTKYWALVEPAIGETDDKPGGLFRIRDDGQGLYSELLVGSGEWRDVPELARYFLQGDSGAFPIDKGRAAQLIAQYPWDGSRALAGMKAEAKGDVAGHVFHGNQWTGGIGEADRSMADAVRALEAPGLISPGRMATTSPSIEAWKQQYGAPAEEYARIMHDWTDRNMGMLQRTVPERSTEAGRRVADLLDHAPTIDQPVFRSTALPDLTKPTFSLPPSSFTLSSGATDFTAKGATSANGVIEVKAGSRGLPIGALSKYPEEREVMEAGSYRIISSDQRTANIYGRDVPYTHVLVEQLPEAKADRSWWDPGRPYTAAELAMAGTFAEERGATRTKDFDPTKHPRDERGRFGEGAGGGGGDHTEGGRALADIGKSYHWGHADPNPAHDDRPYHMRGHTDRMSGGRWGVTTMNDTDFNKIQQSAIGKLNDAGLDGNAVQQSVAGWSYAMDSDLWRDVWNNEPGAERYLRDELGNAVGKDRAGIYEVGIHQAQDLIRSNEIEEPLYRGMYLEPDKAAELTVGKVIDVGGPSSWSRDPVVADVFSHIETDQYHTPVIMQSGAPVHGIDMAPLGAREFAWQREVIVGEDKVRVTSVSKLDDNVLVTVEPA
jgi:hypothetical protein